MWDESLWIGSRWFRSRLIVGTAGFASFEVMRRCHDAAGIDLVTLSLRQLDLSRQGESVLDHIDRARITLLPSTAGCRTVDEAVRTAYLGREAELGDLVLVDVEGDARARLPDVILVLEAVKLLSGEGLTVLAATTADPVVARRLVDAGASALLVSATPVDAGRGAPNPSALRLLLDAVSVPVLVGGGVGTASDAALVLEAGCHGVVVEGAIPGAQDPEGMAEAMKLAVQAGRFAHKASREPAPLSPVAAATPADAPATS